MSACLRTSLSINMAFCSAGQVEGCCCLVMTLTNSMVRASWESASIHPYTLIHSRRWVPTPKCGKLISVCAEARYVGPWPASNARDTNNGQNNIQTIYEQIVKQSRVCQRKCSKKKRLKLCTDQMSDHIPSTQFNSFSPVSLYKYTHIYVDINKFMPE